jgi:hypoxanthine-DNA glycosylase
MLTHPIPPLYDENSRILILGSFPSVKSREACFFYGHPQNRFWKVTSSVFGEEVPQTIDEKKTFLLRNRIALWDVIGSCDIVGSSDSSIRNVTPNDLSIILNSADIEQIYVNGKTAYKYYTKYTEKMTGRSAICLPSTSPANAAWTIERLVSEWGCIRKL